jgi:hypothetical protein
MWKSLTGRQSRSDRKTHEESVETEILSSETEIQPGPAAVIQPRQKISDVEMPDCYIGPAPMKYRTRKCIRSRRGADKSSRFRSSGLLGPAGLRMTTYTRASLLIHQNVHVLHVKRA